MTSTPYQHLHKGMLNYSLIIRESPADGDDTHTNPSFQLIIGYQGGLYEPLSKLVHMGRRDYDVLAGRWTTPDHEIWKRLNSNHIVPFNLYMFKNNNPLSNNEEIKCYMTGKFT